MNEKLSQFFLLKSISKKVQISWFPSYSPIPYLKMPEFYRNILLNWRKFLTYNPSVPTKKLSQYLWFNKPINIGNKSLYFSDFLNHGVSFIDNLVDIKGKYKSWDVL